MECSQIAHVHSPLSSVVRYMYTSSMERFKEDSLKLIEILYSREGTPVFTVVFVTG